MRALPLLLALGLFSESLYVSSRGQTVRITPATVRNPLALDWLLKADGLWTTNQDQLEKQFGASKFVWQDSARTRARFDPGRSKFILGDMEVGETLVSFKDGKISSVTISVINKGDDDDSVIDQRRFDGATSALRQTVAAASGVKEEPRRKEEIISKNANGAVWRSKKALYLGEWLFLPETLVAPAHGEYVRLRILPPMAQLGMQSKMPKVTVSRSVLASHVKREGKKAIIQGVPMVDQGNKGYCAVASFERVLRLYGVDLDMHDLANLAETYGGTNPYDMKDAVFKVAQKLGMTTKEPVFLKGKQMESLSKDYDKEARRVGKSDVPLNRNFWYNVDPEVMKATRMQSGEYKKFRQEIVDSVNKGVPVMWALWLRLFWEDQLEDSFEANRFAVNKDPAADDAIKRKAEERKKEMDELRKKTPTRPPPEMGGGHMRLIIGYDDDKGLLYYTDSWGPGHEMKSMPMDQAYAATMAMFIIAPQ